MNEPRTIKETFMHRGLASFVLICSGLLATAAEPTDKAQEALVDINRAFRDAHAAARQLDLARGGPVIYLRGNDLVLVRNGKETSARVIPPEYHTYKMFAHIPVATYLLLGPPGAGAINAQRLEQLRAYRVKLDRVKANIDGIGFQGAALERQKKLLGAAQTFLDKVIEQKKFSTEELYAFTRGTVGMIRANLAGAAKAQLDGMNQVVMTWKKDMAPDEWQKLRVVVQGAVLAREGNIATQYFEHLLHVKGEGMRLVYMELYFPPTPELTLITTRAVDRGISVAIFADPDRMFRDVLADAATAYLKQTKFD